jgi:thiol-disulfide isomerase/thioredoxin
MGNIRICLGLGLCTLATTPLLAAENNAASPVGRTVENFVLNDFYGKPHALADYKSRKVVVIAVLGTECPLVKLYAPRLVQLQQAYTDKSVQFLGLNANRQDSITEIAAYARVHQIAFPILKDLNNRVVDRLGAVRTPEIFVLDQDRVIRYHGRIDDQYGVGYARKAAAQNFLQAAIDDLIAGKQSAKADTGVVGCFIGRVHQPDVSAKVTYSNQVARILNKRCVACHRQGEIAPFAMTSYAEVSGWADMIAEVVGNRRMPPWFADPKYGHFTNDRSVPDDEKEILYQWAAAGAPEGNPKELPEPPKFVDGWQLPKDPDQVFYMAAKPYRVPAEATVPYQYFAVDPGFKENKWIKAIEARPGNRAIVHHIIVFAQPKGNRDDRHRQFLIGYAPGAAPGVLPAGMAKFVPAGYELLFQMHYTTNGAPGDDCSKVGLVFADPREVTKLVRTTQSINQTFAIPPGADDYVVESDSFAWNFDMDLVELFPHMHLRGKAFRYEIRYPDGKTEMLLDIPHYDFGWQLTYQMQTPKHIPKGAVIHCTAHYDNSENNLSNPDPKATVRWGDQTWDEMMIGFYDVAVPISQADVRAGKVPSFVPGPAEMAQYLMNQFDKNRDKIVSQREIPLEPFRLKAFFMMADKNHNGEITLDELTQFLLEQQKKGTVPIRRTRKSERKETDTAKQQAGARSVVHP